MLLFAASNATKEKRSDAYPTMDADEAEKAVSHKEAQGLADPTLPREFPHIVSALTKAMRLFLH